MATVGPGGHPVSVATWYVWENDRALVNLDEGRKRLKHLTNDPRVSLTVLDGEDWYSHVSIQGRVVDIHDDTELVDIDRIAQHYTGKSFRNRHRGRVSVWIQPERWHVWGSLGES
jgi:PPOX class probable F420-dependent enzyme